ncbi:hypothetical protein FACS189487_09680 [Campylobacterota bacterium]|nr:hypothetical protein FACS189487_09680 [Campylobacterota bacterium]
MGLLDQEKQNAAATSKISGAVVLETDNIPESLTALSTRFGVRTSQIDFVVQSTKTFVKFPHETSEVELVPPLISRLSSPDILADAGFLIRQVHLATFRPMTADRVLSLNTEVAANAMRTRAIATVLPTSKIHNFSSLRDFLLTEINKLKLRYAMIINLRESSMQNDITTLINKIRINDRLLEPFKITLCEWLAPRPTIDANLVLHFNKKQQQEPRTSDRIDYADRGFIKTVDAGDLLIEFVKPKLGSAGRDFRGKFIPVNKPRFAFAPISAPDIEAIETIEDDKTIRYFAKRSGYVNYRKGSGSLTIGDTIQIESVDFKTTGNIQAGLDRSVKIKIEGENVYEDHIGSNTKLEASEIEVSGGIGSGAKVSAVKIVVGGQTHSTSAIVCEEATIGVHKGMIEGKKVKIARLEHGKVSAEEVSIDLAIGGMIWARKITIGILHSHTTLIASEKIEINQLIGGENRLYMEAAANSADRKRFETLLTESKLCTREMNAAFRKYDNKRVMLLRNRPQFEQLRERIDADRALGKIPSSVFVERYNSYLEEMKTAKTMKEELEALQNKNAALADEIGTIQNGILSAVVINRDIWRNYNEVRFRLLSPPKELLYVPKENSRATEIRLEISGIEDYAIKVIE